MELDTFSFNKVLSAFAQEAHDNDAAASKAEELFCYMNTSYQTGVLRKACPDAVSFAAVIHAYAQQ